MYINYYAPDSKLYSETVNKNHFRSWAFLELDSYFANHTILVLEEDSCCQVKTDDLVNISDIQVYCSKLWLRWFNEQV